MKRYGIIYTIIALLAAASSATAQTFTEVDWESFARDTITPYYRCSVPLDEDFSCSTYEATIEYPEFVPMSAEELKKYKLDTRTDTLPSWPEITTSVGISAKRGMLDIGFTPIVYLDNCYQRINSFKLVINKKASTRSTRAMTATRTLTRYADSSVLATGRWVKIRVGESGVYKITKSELAKMGFNDPSKVRLFGYGGRLLPETNIGSISDDLQEVPMWRNNGNLLFYANGTIEWKYTAGEFTHKQNHYSQHSYYFLNVTEGKEPMSFPTTKYDVNTSLINTTFPDHALYEKEEISLCSFGRTLLESYDYSTGRSKQYNISLPGIAAPYIKATVSFGSNASQASTLGIFIDEKNVGTLTIGQASDINKGVITSGKYSGNYAGNDEKLAVTLKHNASTSTVNGHLDYIRITYTRKLALDESYLIFRGTSSSSRANFKIASDKTGIKVWNVTNPSQTTEYQGTYTDGHYIVPAPASYNEEYVAVDINGNFPSVEVVGTIANQNLHATGATDLVIIVPSNKLYTAQAERLAQMHRDMDNMRVKVVSADEVYNEFSSGTPDATAYRRFMKMLYDRATTSEEAPKYLLLMGDAFSDNRLITYKNRRQEDYLLCYSSENSVSTTASYVLEDYFGFLDDSEGSNHKTDKVDIAIGRIPVQNLASLTPVIDKIINYAQNKDAGAWQNNIVLLADDGDAMNPNSHMRDAEVIASLISENFPSFMLRRIYWDDYPMVTLATGNTYPAVNAAIKEQLAEGALIMNYSGHGSSNLLSHEMAWKASDMTNCTSTRLPMWVTASCDISPFDIGDGSIGEEAILNPTSGAVAMFTTTRTVYQTHNSSINRQFMRNILSRDSEGKVITIGEAVRRSKVNLISGNGDLSENKLQYILLGDPALKLNLPEYKAVVDRFGDATADSEAQAGAGSKITVYGHIEDINGNLATNFNGVVSPTMFDYEQEVKTKDNTGLGAFTYHAHTSKLYSGSDSVKSGNFSITIPMPMDISYSDEQGLLNIYAVTHDRSASAQGTYENFIIGGTSSDIANDKKGPEIKLYLNSTSFIDGDDTHPTPCLYVELRDENGINTVGSGIGHDIVAMVDNKAAYTYNLNNAFTPTVGDYTSGTIIFPLSAMPEGTHTLMVRAWDLLNNSSTSTITFNVVPDLAPEFIELSATPNPVHRGENLTFMLTHNRPQSEITVKLEVFNHQGQILWSNTETTLCDGTVYTYTWDVTGSAGQPLPTGIYLYRASLSAGGSSEQTKTRKIIVLNNK